MKLRCRDCGELFDKEEGLEKRICMEDYYGVGDQFEDHTYIITTACPECGSVEVDEYEEWDEEEEEEDEEWHLKSQ